MLAADGSALSDGGISASDANLGSSEDGASSPGDGAASDSCAQYLGSTPASAWVYADPNGKLAYKPLDAQGDTIMDFSSAGYMGGGVSIPAVPSEDNRSFRGRRHERDPGGHRRRLRPPARQRRARRGAATAWAVHARGLDSHQRERRCVARERHGGVGDGDQRQVDGRLRAPDLRLGERDARCDDRDHGCLCSVGRFVLRRERREQLRRRGHGLRPAPGHERVGRVHGDESRRLATALRRPGSLRDRSPVGSRRHVGEREPDHG